MNEGVSIALWAFGGGLYCGLLVAVFQWREARHWKDMWWRKCQRSMGTDFCTARINSYSQDGKWVYGGPKVRKEGDSRPARNFSKPSNYAHLPTCDTRPQTGAISTRCTRSNNPE